MGAARRLADLGERRIVEELLRPRYSTDKRPRFGDDCAFIADGDWLCGATLVATTDPCPEPMASFLGYTSLYYRGWLLAAINLSDLAAAGAHPLGLLTSLIIPNDTTIEDFVSLLDGIEDCCRRVGTRVAGGNLKEGAKIDLTATAIGACQIGQCLSRSGVSTHEKK